MPGLEGSEREGEGDERMSDCSSSIAVSLGLEEGCAEIRKRRRQGRYPTPSTSTSTSTSTSKSPPPISVTTLSSLSPMGQTTFSHKARRRQGSSSHPRPSLAPALSTRPTPLATLLTLLSILCTSLMTPALAVDFTFSWPTPSYTCYPLSLEWSGGVPPFQAILAPSLQIPFVYKIPPEAYVNGTGQYTIDIQLTSGLQYVLMLGDAAGVGTGGSTSLITVQGYSHTECLDRATVNQTAPLQTSFQTFTSNIEQCTESFPMQLDPANGTVPYNMTVISTDQTFDPFDVVIGSDLIYNWTVAVPRGKSFMVMLNTVKGYGYGGVSGIYTVNRTSDGDGSWCLPTQPASTPSSSIAIPTDVSTGSNPYSTFHTGTSTATAGSAGKPLATNVIIGVTVVGCLLIIGICAGIGFYCLIWRRRQRQRAVDPNPQQNNSAYASMAGRRRPHTLEEVDLVSADGASIQSLTSPLAYNQGYYADSSITAFNTDDGRSQTGTTSGTATGTATSAGFAGLGAASANGGPPGSASASNPDQGRKWLPGVEFADSPTTDRNPFNDSPLSAEDAAAALALRHGDTDPSVYGRQGSHYDQDPQAYELREQNPPTGGSEPSLRPTGSRSKSEEAAEEMDLIEQHSPLVGLDSPLPDPRRPDAQTDRYGVRPPASASGTFRITNASALDPPTLATHTPSTNTTPIIQPPRRTAGARNAYQQQPRFVRHEDAGRVARHQHQEEEEVIDLPPLYTDLVREDEQQADSSSPPPSAVATLESPERN